MQPQPDPPPLRDNPRDARCSFCGRWRRDIGRMVEGPRDVFICRLCSDLVVKIFESMDREEEGEHPAPSHRRGLNGEKEEESGEEGQEGIDER